MLGSRTVRRSLRASAPHFVQPLNSRDEDDIKILECHVDGYPRPDIRWEKDGKTVGKSRRVHMVRSGDMCLLQIRMPQEDDFGQYSCIASNIVGTTSTHIRLGTASPQSTKKTRGNSPQLLKPIKSTGLRSRSMERSRDFVKENKNLCSQRSRSRSATRNSKQDIPSSTKSKLSNFTNTIFKRNGDHSQQKYKTSPPRSQQLSKSMEDCRKVRKGFLDKMKIPVIFVQKDNVYLSNENVENTDTVLPILNVTVDSENYSNEIKFNGNSSPGLLRKRLFKSESLKEKSSKTMTPIKNGSLKCVSPRNVPIKNGFPRSESLKNEILRNKEPRDFQLDEPENLRQNKSKSKLASYLKIFENTNSSNKFKKLETDETGSLKFLKHEKNKEKTTCDHVESEGFLARFMRRRSLGGERKSPEPAEIRIMSPTVSQDILHRDGKVKSATSECNEVVKNDNLDKSYLNNESKQTIAKTDLYDDSQQAKRAIVNKEKASCDHLESEGFFARFMRRRSFGGERKSPEPLESKNFVSHISLEFLNADSKLKGLKSEGEEIDRNNRSNEIFSSVSSENSMDKLNKSNVHVDNQIAQVLPAVTNNCSDVNSQNENESKKESAKNIICENSEVLDTKDSYLSDSTNSHSTEENTAIELTPSTENADIVSPQDIVPTEEKLCIPSISVHEIPDSTIYECSEETIEANVIEKKQSSEGDSIENTSVSVDKECEGTIRYLNDEKCEDILGSATQKESLESDLHRVSSPIESPARIVKGPQSVTVLRGESVTLAISFTGEPLPSVIWMKGGRVLRCSEDGRLSILEGREMSVVTVNEVTADDSGKYVVCVENEGGGDSRFASVAVVGMRNTFEAPKNIFKPNAYCSFSSIQLRSSVCTEGGFPEPPGGEPTASEFTDHSLVLSWYGSMYDGGSVVTGYQVEMCTLPDKKWHKVTSSVNTSCSVQGLSMGQEYIFRVRAENRYGVSHPSKESKIIRLNDYLQYDTSSDEEPEEVPESAVTIENGTHFAERFDLKEEVGKGRFGTVYRCVELSCGRARAAKIIRCLKMKDKEKVRQEIEIMSRLHHPKLMQVLAAFESGKNMIMVMEFISGGELFERVIADDFVLTEHDCILFMRQICDGVAYMHKNNILHLDLKPENILCKTRTSHKIKIIDFGLAREYNTTDNLRILFGTPEFVAPEVLNYEPVSPASDMWSVGVICYVLLSGLSPFMGDSDTETFANITRAEMDFDDDAFDEISQDAKDFISSLLVKKIKGRMSAEECLKHPWLATPRLIQKRPLSTEKLKRFIIRRKWQKSGTAIRALGRMVSLSRSSLGSSCDSYSPIGSPTSSRSRTSLASRSETADSGDSEVFSR